MWGYGILGKGPIVSHAKEPTQIPSMLFGRNELQPDSRIIAVNAGIGHLAAVSNHGDLYMWGRNRRGCLGLGNVKDQFFPLKVWMLNCVPLTTVLYIVLQKLMVIQIAKFPTLNGTRRLITTVTKPVTR